MPIDKACDSSYHIYKWAFGLNKRSPAVEGRQNHAGKWVPHSLVKPATWGGKAEEFQAHS